MAIQVRKGLKKDFDPYKMLPGEWAVSIDNQTQNQIVWMCFAAGVVKRMGTYEDFKAQIEDATHDIRDQYVAEFDKIEKIIKQLADTTQSNTDIVIQIKSDIVNTYLPQIQQYASTASQKAQEATGKATEAEDYSKLSESHSHGNTGVRLGEDTDNSKFYSEWSKLYMDEAKETSENAESTLKEVNKKLGLAEFSLDDDGNLIYTDGSAYNFNIDNDGNLYWEVA